MVVRRLRAKQLCSECSQEVYMFSNMRFYDCDFYIEGETILGRKFLKKGTTGRLLPADDKSFHEYASEQISKIPSFVDQENLHELSKIVYAIDPRGRSFNNVGTRNPENDLSMDEFGYLLSQ